MLPLFLILTAAFAVLTWKNLHAGLLLLVAVLPSYLLRTEILGVPMTLLELLVVTFLVVWLFKRGSRQWLCAWRNLPPRRQAQLLSQTRILPIVLILLASTISVFIAPDLVNALGVWKAYFVEPILLFFVIRSEISTTEPMNANVSGDTLTSRLFVALGVSALVLSLVGIAQWLTGTGLPIPWDIERRVTSVFDYPNALGLFLGPIVVISTLVLLSPFPAPRPVHRSFSEGGSLGVGGRGVASDGAKTPMKIFWVTTILLSFIAIILAQSEAAIVSILAVLSIIGVLHAKTRYPTAVGILVVVLFILLSPWRALVIDKLTLQDYSGQVRLSQWSETADLLKDHWLLGAGLSGYPTALEPYHQATHLEIFQYPHNIVLNIWVELGLLGLFAFVLLAWQVVLSTWRKLKPAATASRFTLHAPQTIAFFALLQMTIHGLVDVPYFKNDLAILTWILLAIVLTYARPSTPSTPSH